MSKMVELLKSFQLSDGGFSESHLEGVHFFKSTQPIPRTPLVYDPGICIVAQGRKIGYLGNPLFFSFFAFVCLLHTAEVTGSNPVSPATSILLFPAMQSISFEIQYCIHLFIYLPAIQPALPVMF